MESIPRSTMNGITAAAGLLAALLACAATARAQVPHLGDVQRLPVITIALQAGSTGVETKKVTYTPPPGWYVRSHAVVCTARTGNSSYSVNTVPQHWATFNEAKIKESYRS